MKCNFGDRTLWKEKRDQCQKILELLAKFLTKHNYYCYIKESDDMVEITIENITKSPMGWITYYNYSEEDSIYIDQVQSNIEGIGLGNLLICLAICFNPNPAVLKKINLSAVTGEKKIKALLEKKRKGESKSDITPESLFKYYESIGFKPLTPIVRNLSVVYQDFTANIEDLFEIGCTDMLTKKIEKSLS